MVWGGDGALLFDAGALDFAGGTVVHMNGGMAGLVLAIGFNAGSAFGANAIAGVALLTTTIATAAAGLTWMILEWVIYKKPTLLGIASGIVAGLVAITPAAGFVGVGGAFVVGIVGSIVGFFGVVVLKKKLGYDDSLDAFGIHFLAGLWGALATGLLALNDKELLWDGPLKESGDRMGQWARVDSETEEIGLDESLHGERGMNL